MRMTLAIGLSLALHATMALVLEWPGASGPVAPSSGLSVRLSEAAAISVIAANAPPIGSTNSPELASERLPTPVAVGEPPTEAVEALAPETLLSARLPEAVVAGRLPEADPGEWQPPVTATVDPGEMVAATGPPPAITANERETLSARARSSGPAGASMRRPPAQTTAEVTPPVSAESPVLELVAAEPPDEVLRARERPVSAPAQTAARRTVKSRANSGAPKRLAAQSTGGAAQTVAAETPARPRTPRESGVAAATAEASSRPAPPSPFENAGAGPARAAMPAPGNAPPEYPLRARRRGQQGRVVLRVAVASDGSAGNPAVVSSSGHRTLDKAAVRAVSSWRFEAARDGGRRVASTVEVPVTFRLED